MIHTSTNGIQALKFTRPSTDPSIRIGVIAANTNWKYTSADCGNAVLPISGVGSISGIAPVGGNTIDVTNAADIAAAVLACPDLTLLIKAAHEVCKALEGSTWNELVGREFAGEFIATPDAQFLEHMREMTRQLREAASVLLASTSAPDSGALDA